MYDYEKHTPREIELPDQEYRDVLQEIGESEIDVSEWEARFIKSILSTDYPLSDRQKSVVDRMRVQYLDQEEFFEDFYYGEMIYGY